MLVTPPFGASSNIALWRAYSKPPVELVVADLEGYRPVEGTISRSVFFYAINNPFLNNGLTKCEGLNVYNELVLQRRR